MSEPELHHRLAAILSAEGEGYTRLLAEDEAATVRSLSEARELISASVSRHRGRVVDAVGDNLLAELPSALDAVRCSVEVQRALHERRSPCRSPAAYSSASGCISVTSPSRASGSTATA